MILALISGSSGKPVPNAFGTNRGKDGHPPPPETAPLAESELIEELVPEPEVIEELAPEPEAAIPIAEPEPEPEPEVIEELAPEPEPVMEIAPEPEPVKPVAEEPLVFTPIEEPSEYEPEPAVVQEEAKPEPEPEPETIEELVPEPEPVMEAVPEPTPTEPVAEEPLAPAPAEEQPIIQEATAAPTEPEVSEPVYSESAQGESVNVSTGETAAPEEQPADELSPEEGGQYVPVSEEELTGVGAPVDTSSVLELTDEEFTNVVRALTAGFAPPWEQQFQRDKISQAVEISEEEFNFIRDTSQFS